MSVSCTSAMVSARFALDPLGPRSNALHALARGWMRGLRHNLRHTLVWWEADFRPRRGLGFLRLLRPSCSGCLLCAFGSLSRSHALGGIGPSLLSATHGAVFDHDQPGIGMNVASLCHRRSRHHNLNLQSVECFSHVVIAVLHDSGEVWTFSRTIGFPVPDSS